MAKLSIRPGSTSVSVDIFIQDSSVTTGAGLTGLVFNSGSLTAYYKRNGNTAPVAITLATLAAITTAWSSGGFIACDGTNTPGLYRLDIPDAALATGVRGVVIMLKGASNMSPCLLEIDLSNEANVWAWHSNDLLTGGGAFRRLGIIDSGTAQSVSGTTLQMRAAATLADSEAIGATALIYSATTGAGQSRYATANVGSSDTLTVDTWTTTPTGTVLYDLYAGSPASATLLPSVALNAAGLATDAATEIAGAVWDLATSGHTTAATFGAQAKTVVDAINTKTAFLPSATAGAAGGVFIAGSNAATSITTALTANIIGNITGNLSGTVGTVTNLTNAPTAGDFTATMKTSIGTAVAASAVASVTGNVGGNVGGSVGSVVGAVGSVTGNVGGNVNGSVASVTTVNDKTGYSMSAAGVDAIWDELQSGHTVAGTFGKYLDSAVSGVSTGGLAIQDIVDGILDEPVAAHAVTGSVGANLADTNTDGNAIRSKTDNLTFSVAGKLDVNITNVKTYSINGVSPPFS